MRRGYSVLSRLCMGRAAALLEIGDVQVIVTWRPVLSCYTRHGKLAERENETAQESDHGRATDRSGGDESDSGGRPSGHETTSRVITTVPARKLLSFEDGDAGIRDRES